MKRHGRQTRLGDSLQVVVGKLGRKNMTGAITAKVGAAWLAIVGASVQSHTTGAYMKDDVLIVYVDSPAWATELSAMSERYRNAINEEIGQELVGSIRFTVSRKVAEQHRIAGEALETDAFYNEDDVPSVPLTPTELAQVVDSVSTIGDRELRETVLRATVKDIEWKKGIAAHTSREGPRERP